MSVRLSDYGTRIDASQGRDVEEMANRYKQGGYGEARGFNKSDADTSKKLFLRKNRTISLFEVGKNNVNKFSLTYYPNNIDRSSSDEVMNRSDFSASSENLLKQVENGE
jgi:hypothetical protein